MCPDSWLVYGGHRVPSRVSTHPALQCMVVLVSYFVGLLFLVWTIEEMLNIQVFATRRAPLRV